jgi:hypothetical protein
MNREKLISNISPFTFKEKSLKNDSKECGIEVNDSEVNLKISE